MAFVLIVLVLSGVGMRRNVSTQNKSLTNESKCILLTDFVISQ